MPDNRSQEVQHFRESQGAKRVHLLTINTPFSPSQDRFVLAELPQDAFLFACGQCSPRVTIGYGQLHNIRAETLRTFLGAVEEANAEWIDLTASDGRHDGVTFTFEVADAAGYRRLRAVSPPPGSPAARLVAAWTAAFPPVRRAVR